MTRPVVIEAARHTETHEVHFRFVCSACGVEGAWHPSLNDAERSGERHNRTKHAVAVSA